MAAVGRCRYPRSAMPAPPVTGLPIEAVLPALREALAGCASAVLEAPPGAGKTTLVPLHLLAEPWLAGRRILMLEPRRLAARAAAATNGELLGEEIGGTVGYAVRFERRIERRRRGSRWSPRVCSRATCSAIRRWRPMAA